MSIRAINWAREVAICIDMPSKHRLVLFMVCMHHHDKTGACFPSYETIAQATGFSRRKTIDLVADIEANGLIARQLRRVDGRQSSNNFMLFGRPAAPKWRPSRVHKSAPCQSANGGTLARVQTGAPDRDYSTTKGEAPANETGGNVIAMTRRAGHA